MTTYSRSQYKNPFGNVSPNGAKSRGWGSGWPNCQSGKMKTVSGGGVRVTVRAEVAEMVMHLLAATDKIYNIKAGSTGAYNCRPIAGTSTPSNHSWGLALDMNWDDNPMSTTFHSEIPPKVVAMWNDCGWYWGGFYNHRYDTMHFEYIGKPSDVASDTAQAIRYNKGVTGNPTPPATGGGSSIAVSVAAVAAAAKSDPASKDGKPHSGDLKDMIMVVEKALVAEGLLDSQYVDGLFGSKSVEAYKKWQQKLKYSGSDADGIPGYSSLKALGDRHKFVVLK